ncbi:MAG: MoaD/ThiS family protein [Thermodesulfobacteriota bacterium]
MTVKVRLSNLLRQATDWQEMVEVTAKTPEECLHAVVTQFPDVRKWIYDKNGKMWDRIQFFVNGKRIHPDRLGKPVQDGDELHILLNIGGG